MKMLMSFFVLFVSLSAFADTKPAPKTETPDTFSKKTGFVFSGGLDFTFFSYPAYITNVTNRMSIGGNLEVEYFFHKNFGVFVGANYLSRGLQGSTPPTNTSDFLDIPFGLAINTGGFTDDSRSHINLGLYYASPLSSNFSDPSTLSGLNNGKTKSFIGAFVSYQFMFAMMDHLGFGVRLYGKIPFAGAIDVPNAANREYGLFYEAGAGLNVISW